MIQDNISELYNLEDIIERGPNNSLILDNITFYVNFDDFTIPQMNIFFEKYRGVIIESCVKVKLTEELMHFYIYRPKYLSLKLYGTTDLWHLILWVNDMTSATQFNKKIIYVLDPDALETLERIISIEKQKLLDNHENPDIIDLNL